MEPSGSTVVARTQSQIAHEELDVGLRVLEERLKWIDSHRELAALRCQQFTEMMEARLAKASVAAAQEDEDEVERERKAFHSQPGCRPRARGRPLVKEGESDASCGGVARDVFSAGEYYASGQRPMGSSHRHHRSRKPSPSRHTLAHRRSLDL